MWRDIITASIPRLIEVTSLSENGFIIFCIDLSLILVSSLPFYLLCQFLKSEADVVEVTVMEFFLERRSQLDVFVLVQSLFQAFILWQEYRNQ